MIGLSQVAAAPILMHHTQQLYINMITMTYSIVCFIILPVCTSGTPGMVRVKVAIRGSFQIKVVDTEPNPVSTKSNTNCLEPNPYCLNEAKLDFWKDALITGIPVQTY